MITPDLAFALADEVTRRSRKPQFQLRSATVRETGITDVLVLVDGDTTTIAVQCFSDIYVNLGDRVTVFFYEPHGAVIIGRITAHENLLEPTAWTNVSFQNLWVNSGTYQTQYRKWGDNVQMRGGISGAAAVLGTVMFTVPVGFRPPYDINLPTVAGGGTIGIVTVQTDGDVVMSFGDKNFTSLDIIYSTSL